MEAKKIISNEQGKCPVCNNDIEYLDVVDAEESGAYRSWKCHHCQCTGKEYLYFVDHYDVYTEDGETRVDDEDAIYRISRERLLKLLSNAISTLHETSGEKVSYKTLYDYATDIDITEEEYNFIMKDKLPKKKYEITRQPPQDYFTIEDENGLLADDDGNTLRFDSYEEAEEYIEDELE